MDIKIPSFSKVEKLLEDNAFLIALGGGVYARAAENNSDISATINALISHFTNMGMPTNVGAGGYGALGEAIYTLSNPSTLMNKLFKSNHLYSTEVKAGIAIYALSELGVIPAAYKKTGIDVLKGGAVAAIVMPASGEDRCRPVTANNTSNHNSLAVSRRTIMGVE